VPLLIILFLFKRIRINVTISILAIYLIVFFTLNFYFKETKLLLGRSNYYFAYTLLEYLSLSGLLWLCVRGRRIRIYIAILSAMFVIFLIFFYASVKMARVDSVPIGIESILLMTYIVFYFFNEFKTITNENVYDRPTFWIAIGVFIYIGATFFLNILGNSLAKEDFNKYYYYSYFGDILKNIFFAIAIIFFAKSGPKEKKNIITKVPYLDMI